LNGRIYSRDVDAELRARGPLPPFEMDTEPDEPLARERRIANYRLLWEHRQFLTRVVIRVAVVVLLLSFLIPNRYESTTRLMPPDEKGGSGLAAIASLVGKSVPGLGMLANDALGAKNSGALFVGVLQSRTVQDDLILKFNLRKVYWDRKWEDARKDLASRTDVSEDRKSGIITIVVTDHDRQRATAMAEEYVNALNNAVNNLSTSSAHRERVFLENRLSGVNVDLEAAEREFSQFASKNVALDIKEESKAMLEAAGTLQGQLSAAQSELEGLKQIYTDNNVRVRTVEARIGELQKQIQKLGGKYNPDINGQITENASGAPNTDDSLYPTIRRMPVLGVSYADLFRRTKVQEAIFETLTQEYEMAKVQEAKEIPTVKVLDPASSPESKSFPPRILILLACTILAFAGASAWVIGEERWKHVDPSDPGRELAAEVYGTIRAEIEKRRDAHHKEGEEGSRWRFWSRTGSSSSGNGVHTESKNGKANDSSSDSHHDNGDTKKGSAE
jgi:capsule polysaccharide export protein KpsE/RkpR